MLGWRQKMSWPNRRPVHHLAVRFGTKWVPFWVWLPECGRIPGAAGVRFTAFRDCHSRARHAWSQSCRCGRYEDQKPANKRHKLLTARSCRWITVHVSTASFSTLTALVEHCFIVLLLSCSQTRLAISPSSVNPVYDCWFDHLSCNTVCRLIQMCRLATNTTMFIAIESV